MMRESSYVDHPGATNRVECMVKGCDHVSESWDDHKAHVLKTHPLRKLSDDDFVMPELRRG